MISFDQVLLLQERVESAVAKIAQLNAENAALRRKCAELTNALAAKTEQFSSFQSDQSKIEEGILKALNRLDVVENEVLKNAVLDTSGSEKSADAEKLPENPSAVAAVTFDEMPDVEKQPELPENSPSFPPEESVNPQNAQINEPSPVFAPAETVSQADKTQSFDEPVIEADQTSQNLSENPDETQSESSTPGLFDIF